MLDNRCRNPVFRCNLSAIFVHFRLLDPIRSIAAVHTFFRDFTASHCRCFNTSILLKLSMNDCFVINAATLHAFVRQSGIIISN